MREGKLRGRGGGISFDRRGGDIENGEEGEGKRKRAFKGNPRQAKCERKSDRRGGRRMFTATLQVEKPRRVSRGPKRTHAEKGR